MLRAARWSAMRVAIAAWPTVGERPLRAVLSRVGEARFKAQIEFLALGQIRTMVIMFDMQIICETVLRTSYYIPSVPK